MRYAMVFLLALAFSASGADTPAKPEALHDAPGAQSRVFKDPVTGELRAPTAEELKSSPLPAVVEDVSKTAPGLTVFELPDGRRGVRVGKNFRHYSRAQTGPDGAVHLNCSQNHSHEAQP